MPPGTSFNSRVKAAITNLIDLCKGIENKLDTLAGFCVSMRKDVSKNAGFLADYIVVRTVLMEKGIITDDKLKAKAEDLQIKETDPDPSKKDSKGEGVRPEKG